jgi:hypothetical protein
MRQVSERIVKNYQWNKWANPCQFLMVIVLLAGGLIALVAGMQTDNDDAEYWLLLIAVLSGCAGFVLACNDNEPLKRDKENPLYPLLERWKKWTGLPVSKIPTTPIQVMGYAGWAKTTMKQLAMRVTIAYKQQEELHKAAGEWMGHQNDACVTYMTIAGVQRTAKQYEEDMLKADKEARRAKEQFLGFWDLVTEKEESLGILKGSEWQDPEAYRKNLLRLYEKKLLVE